MDSYTEMLLAARNVAMDAERKGFFGTAEAMRSVVDNFLSNPSADHGAASIVDKMQRYSREG